MNLEAKTITKEQYERFTRQQDKIQAVQTQMQMFQQNCETKLAEYQAETRKLWEEIKRDHPDLDLENVVWVPSKNAHTIVAVQVRLNNG